MTASSFEERKEWFDEGVAAGAGFMIVVTDTFDWEDYPVFVKPGKDVQEKVDKYSKHMQKVMEVFDLSLDWDAQSDGNAWNLGE